MGGTMSKDLRDAEPDRCNKHETQFITVATVAMRQNVLLGGSVETTEKAANKS